MVEWILKTEKSEKPWVINIVLISDEFITQIHEEYLKKKTPTDVLSFNLSEDFEDYFEGEIYISINRTQEQAKTYNVSLTCELYRLIAHGMLHLLGFDDKTDKERQIMREREDTILKKFALL
ncbi:rRNA maturation RNase YbeY [candidate division KSB1 bacterium]|nr:rRNA maturation RNase YbeY [candidate division KSB1 bacterium]